MHLALHLKGLGIVGLLENIYHAFEMERAHDSECSVEGLVDSGNISGWCINGRQIAYIIGSDGAGLCRES